MRHRVQVRAGARERNAVASWLVVAALGSGCQHAGTGVGELRAPTPGAPNIAQTQGRVAFTWRSGADPSEGQIEAVLPGGRRFHGTYVQPRTTQWRNDYDLYWGAWTGPWGYARPWYLGPRSSFLVQYSGKALAHLEAPDSARMRCEFTLYQPDAGLAGGGQGDCQLSSNEEVFDAVLAREP